MASKTTQSANDFLNYWLRNAAPSWDGATTLYMALHTGAVGLGGDQATNEVSYTGYARVALLRNNTTGEFSVSTTGQSANQNLIQFGNATAGSFYVRLHTADPGEAGTGSTNEVSYTGYAPVAVARTAGGWTVSGNQVSNTATVLDVYDFELAARERSGYLGVPQRLMRTPEKIASLREAREQKQAETEMGAVGAEVLTRAAPEMVKQAAAA